MKTHCRNGHEMVADNRYERPNGKVSCRTCQRAALAAWRERRAAVGGGECVRGHEQIPENISPSGRCRLCNAEDSRRAYKRKRISGTCRAGHVMTPENTIAGGRCRECRIAMRAAMSLDPERLELRREYQRIWADAQRRKAGIPERKWGPNNHRLPGHEKTETVPAGPFLAWLSTCPQTDEMLCLTAGRSSRPIRRARQDGQNLSLTYVDALLCAAGAQYRLLELYPLDEEEMAA